MPPENLCNKMRDIIIFSMTSWNEQPRLRHQVARLLANAGYRVFFFQKTSYIGTNTSQKIVSAEDNIFLIRSKCLIHLQLRFGGIVNYVNNFVEKISIQENLRKLNITEFSVINFNFDYYFIRDLFPHSRIITIINDDFVSQAKFFSGIHFKKSLQRTCRISNEVLVVSDHISRSVSNWCNPKLFYPWSDISYTPPTQSHNRNKILIWANIDKRIDFSLLGYLLTKLPEFEFEVYGNCATDQTTNVNSIKHANCNVRFFPPSELWNIHLDAFFCSLIPYRCDRNDILAVAVSNKTFQLMARGLPIVTSGMPNFLDHPAILKATSYQDVADNLLFCKENFHALQSEIEILVNNNNSFSRFAFLSSLLNS